MTAPRKTPTCSTTGGRTQEGKPCLNRADPTSPDGRCRLHPVGPKGNEVAHPRKVAFLAAYAELGNVRDAAEIAGVSRRIHYAWLDGDGDYAAAFEDAREAAADVLERSALERAVAGIDEPVFYKGEVVGSIKRYSDSLLMFLLRGVRPEKFRERVDLRNVTPRDPSVDRAVLDLIGSPEALDQLGALGRVLSGASDDEA